jgi:hypothetical protein
MGKTQPSPEATAGRPPMLFAPPSIGRCARYSISRFIPLDSRGKSVKPPPMAFQLAGPLQVISFNLLDDRALTPISDGEEDCISEL